jgi:hypothetical protein
MNASDSSDRALAAGAAHTAAQRDEFLALLLRIQPHLDAIVCYASTMDEHEPNRLALDVHAAIFKATGVQS